MNVDQNVILEQWKNIIETEMTSIIESTNEPVEGSIHSVCGIKYSDVMLPKQLNLITITQIKNVNNILEIGFNSGFSALLILLSNPNIQLTCVDICSHKYTIPCFNFLKQRFGIRINLIQGSSVDVLEKLVNDNLKYDLIHIDGCHDVAIAEKDIDNSVKLSKKDTIIIFDDTNLSKLMKVWRKKCSQHNIQKFSHSLIYSTKLHSFGQIV